MAPNRLAHIAELSAAHHHSKSEGNLRLSICYERNRADCDDKVRVKDRRASVSDWVNRIDRSPRAKKTLNSNLEFPKFGMSQQLNLLIEALGMESNLQLVGRRPDRWSHRRPWWHARNRISLLRTSPLELCHPGGWSARSRRSRHRCYFEWSGREREGERI